MSKEEVLAVRRNDLDICADILQVARAGAKKTQIVYQANLNFKIVKGYLQRLIANGMLDPSPEGRLYVTTSVGVDFIERYRALVSPLKVN
jgi:predicted transcriptional regulator|tara:strand:- start:118 stop:387 length:270 start_codon:yes stop_codon:yes gene_type:complete